MDTLETSRTSRGQVENQCRGIELERLFKGELQNSFNRINYD